MKDKHTDFPYKIGLFLFLGWRARQWVGPDLRTVEAGPDSHPFPCFSFLECQSLGSRNMECP